MKTYKPEPLYTTKEVKTFIAQAKKAESIPAVFSIARSLVKEKLSAGTIDSENANILLHQLAAIGKSVYYMENAVSPIDYIQHYAIYKYNRYLNGDTGAIGDFIETACHLVAYRELWRTKKANLHVSAIGKLDITINHISYEVGHNAKSWNCTREEVEEQKHDGIIYGVIDNETIEKIIAIMKVNPKQAITAICNRMYVFENKSDYFDFMEKAITEREMKDGRIISITQYNKYRHNIFLREAKARHIPTLTQYMKALGNNDYLI